MNTDYTSNELNTNNIDKNQQHMGTIKNTKGYCEIHYEFYKETNSPDEEKPYSCVRTMKVVKNHEGYYGVPSAWFNISASNPDDVATPHHIDVCDDNGTVYLSAAMFLHNDDHLTFWEDHNVFVDNYVRRGKRWKSYTKLEKVVPLYLSCNGVKIRIYDRAMEKGELKLRYVEQNYGNGISSISWQEHGQANDSGKMLVNPDGTYELVKDDEKNINHRDMAFQKYWKALEQWDIMEGIYPDSTIPGFHYGNERMRQDHAERYRTIRMLERTISQVNDGTIFLDKEPSTDKQTCYIKHLCDKKGFDGSKVKTLTKHQAMHFINVLTNNDHAWNENELITNEEIENTYKFYCTFTF